MTAQAPVLADITLPCPVKYKSSWRAEGGAQQAANGALKLAVINTRNRGNFTMDFELLSESDESDMLDAWDALRTTSAVFVDPLGRTYNVTRHPSMEELEFDWQPTGIGWRASASMALMEVLETD